MQVAILRFCFTHPLHIHGERADYETSETTLHNDTLHAAIIAACAHLGQIPETLPEMAFSSLFPFWKDATGTPQYFLPRPLMGEPILPNHQQADSPIDPKDRKAFKKVQWLAWPLLERFLKGDAAFQDQQQFLANEALLKGAFAYSKHVHEVPEAIYTAEQTPRTRISRENKDTTIYYSERIRFVEGAGLYAMAVLPDGTLPAVNNALDYLCDAGLGTDRTVGNGAFTYEWDTLTLPDVPNPIGYYVAGMLLPEAQAQYRPAFEAPQSGWHLEKRGGWLTQEPYLGLRKKHVWMLAPGAYLHGLEIPRGLVAGHVADLRPDNVPHPVWRSGRTLLLPVASPLT
jgi:CRISPR type III-A-associated RAMP protein Csm4